MARESKMALLGRRGGRRGGPARAAALTPARREEIARKAARTRWTRPVLVIDRLPRDHEELVSFVAHYGSRVSTTRIERGLEDVVLKAVKASRRDSALARMLPVFLWRARAGLELERLEKKVKSRSEAAALGYFLQLAARLGAFAGFDATVARLKSLACPRRLSFFFATTACNPFEAMIARERTPDEALEWGLLTGTPTDSFETYFRKVASL